MNKNICAILLILLVIPVICFLSGCGDDKNKGNNENQTIVGITFNDETFTYDGTEKCLTISGELPNGVSVSYQNNVGTDVGIYNAKAVLSGKNYQTLTLTATLTISKALIVGVTFEDETFTYDGTEKSIAICGELPNGVSVSYQNNVGTEVGIYNAIAVLSGKNYQTLTLTAILTIKSNPMNIALNVVEKLFVLPNTTDYLPNAFNKENKIVSEVPDFNNFVDVQNIPTNFIGKQMNVVYSLLENVDTASKYLSTFYGLSDLVISLYQNFINDNPDNYAVFEYNNDDLKFNITLNNNDYQIFAEYLNSYIELSYNSNSNTNIGKVEIPGGNIIKYEQASNGIKIAVDVLNVALMQIELTKNNQLVVGTLYEYMGTEENNIKTCALIKIDSNYTTIISNKREIDDLQIEAYTEIYSNSTGDLIGYQVDETVNNIKYNTLWFNLKDINGIDNIKVVDEENGLNLDTIYINNSLNPIQTKLIGGFGLDMASRRFDIEMKTVYAYQINAQTQDYEKVSFEIPMLFIQKEYVNAFSSDFYEKNQDNGMNQNPSFNLNSSDYNKLCNLYTSDDAESFKQAKDLVSYNDILNYVNI